MELSLYSLSLSFRAAVPSFANCLLVHWLHFVQLIVDHSNRFQPWKVPHWFTLDFTTNFERKSIQFVFGNDFWIHFGICVLQSMFCSESLGAVARSICVWHRFVAMSFSRSFCYLKRKKKKNVSRCCCVWVCDVIDVIIEMEEEQQLYGTVRLEWTGVLLYVSLSLWSWPSSSLFFCYFETVWFFQWWFWMEFEWTLSLSLCL